ncbi:MAG: MFS transporter [Clostridia bacterium]|nr:MFS transporter [Clostridia bacterium]
MDKNTKRSMIGWIFICCWATYLTAYLCRVNFSSAMSSITLEKGLTAEKLGIIGAVYYAVYACGQLVNGYIGDRVRANRFILLAITGAMLCNIGMAFTDTFAPMLILWGINGCFQSMFWSTIIRVLAQNIPADKRATISAGISLAMPVAYIVSWGLMGRCLDGAAVKWYFLIPAMVCVPLMGAWLALSGRLNFDLAASAQKHGVRETVGFLGGERLLWMVLVCMFHGLIKEGVAYWTPMLVNGMDIARTWSPYLLASILPTANLIGILLSRSLLQKSTGSPYHILVILAGSIALVSSAMLIKSEGLFAIGMMALVSGLCYANNTILMSFLPMQYTEKNMVASIIGVFDFASYVGAAVSTYVLGKVLSSLGFAPLPGIWLGAAVVEMLIAALVIRLRAADRKRHN